MGLRTRLFAQDDEYLGVAMATLPCHPERTDQIWRLRIARLVERFGVFRGGSGRQRRIRVSRICVAGSESSDLTRRI